MVPGRRLTLLLLAAAGAVAVVGAAVGVWWVAVAGLAAQLVLVGLLLVTSVRARREPDRAAGTPATRELLEAVEALAARIEASEALHAAGSLRHTHDLRDLREEVARLAADRGPTGPHG